MKTPNEAKAKVLGELWRVPLFDVHSHYCGEAGEIESVDAFVGAWTQPEIPPAKLSEEDLDSWRRSRWKMKKSLWLSRAFPLALRELYEADDQERIKTKMNDVRRLGLEGSLDWMRRKSNVDYLVVDSNPELARRNDWILSTYRLDPPSIANGPCELGERLQRIETRIEELRRTGGIHCFKIPMAYYRSLYIEDVSLGIAEKVSTKKPAQRSTGEQKALEDFLLRHLLRKAAEWSMPVEIHTGFGWAIGQRPLRLSEADPENLLPILEDPEYRSIKFILFHGGYPFISKMGYIAGAFSNVNLDFTCLCPESWTMLKRALHEWIDIVPMDRILTGSDGSYEWLYLAAKYNRECLAEVLVEKMESEYMDLDLALRVGRHILSDNGRRIFQVD